MKVKLTHPVKNDPVGTHWFAIQSEDACHYYVTNITINDGLIIKVRKDAVITK